MGILIWKKVQQKKIEKLRLIRREIMCGRYTTNTEDEILEIRDIVEDIKIKISQDEYQFLGKEVYPSCLAPVITKSKELRVLKWGFKKWDGKGLIFNARSEGIETSKYFNPHVNENRCLIPAKLYFEWEKKKGKAIEKYQIKDANSELILMAGIVKKNDEGQEEYTIITKEAEEELSFIHERMPVIVDYAKAIRWLDGTIPVEEILNNQIMMNYQATEKKLE